MWEHAALAPGSLLVATPVLVDPNFADSVVLLLDADGEGALGVVLNQPLPIPVHEVLPAWRDVVTDPDVLFKGGPVSPEGALAVALMRDPAAEPAGFRRVHGRLGVVDLDSPEDELAPTIEALRIFAGYAGWGAGQLEGEVAEGSWYVVPCEADDAFRDDPADLWRDVLRRQPGQLAWHATRPVDPDLN